jgi:methionyl-tRNA synthetase
VGLKEWDISRDAPYFGYEIPNEPGKYFYVWLDAPIGYMASFKDLCNKTPTLDFDTFWNKDSTTELYHFIGKDIINFHCLFWPACLHATEMRMPTRIFAHGFLTVNGKKMSKSKGTFIEARTYLNHLDPEYLRYYFFAKLSSKVEDFDFSLEDFVQRVNSDLVNKYINIASRCAKLIHRLGGRLHHQLDDPDLLNTFQQAAEPIQAHYENRDYAKASQMIMRLANQVNIYIDENAPWSLAKQEATHEKALLVCSMGIHCFRILSVFLKPVLPSLIKKIEIFLNDEVLSWKSIDRPLTDHVIHPFKPLLKRITYEQAEKILHQ